MTPFGIIADDISGAADTGAQFSRRGARVLVCVDYEEMPQPEADAWDVVVVNTHTRNSKPADARREVRRANNWLAHAGWPARYKKIDSTLRGNIAAELEEMLALGTPHIVFAPAFPLNGRTMEGGVVLVNGEPVHETEMGRDPFSPVTGSQVRGLFGKAFEPIESLGLEALRSEGPGALDQVKDAFKRGCRLLLADAATQDDLARLATVLTSPWGEVLVAGSAGAARELAIRLCAGGSPPAPPFTVRTGPVLVICGSHQEVTQRQVALLRKRGGCYAVEIDPLRVKDPWDDAARTKIAAEAEKSAALAIRGGARTLVVTIAPGEQGPVAPAMLQWRSERLNELLNDVALRLVKRMDCPGVIMTGGDTAMAVLTGLGARSLQMGGELLPGIPLAWAADGPLHGLRLVTKAGGYGPPEALVQATLALAN